MGASTPRGPLVPQLFPQQSRSRGSCQQWWWPRGHPKDRGSVSTGWVGGWGGVPPCFGDLLS